MKILLSGYHNPHYSTITEYMERAIQGLGHSLFVFEDRQHIIPGIIRYRMNMLNQLSLWYINKKILSLAEKEKPDLAIVTGGHRISAKTVNTLKKYGVITVLWTIDAPRVFDPIIKVARFYDHIFCQGTEAIELLYRAGITGAKWLPMGCDPELHKPIELSDEDKRHYGNDIVFVGSYYPERAWLFEKLTDFDFAIWGPGWEQLGRKSSLYGCIRGTHTTPSDWLKIYSASKIILATHYHDPNDSFPVYQASPRIFEAMACGAFVISDNQRDVSTLFKHKDHLDSFNTPDDLVEKVRHYLAHPGKRSEIARRGREEVLDKHTYAHRIRTLISFIGTKGSSGNG